MKCSTGLVIGAVFVRAASAATCDLKPSYSTPVTSSGWQAQLIARNLTSPRGIIFDGSGNLLVVQKGAGIVHLAFDDGGSTCLDVKKKTFLVNSTDVGSPKIESGREKLTVNSLIMESHSQTMERPFTLPPPRQFSPGPTMLPLSPLVARIKLSLRE